MKPLFSIVILAVSLLTARAQATNISYVLTVDEGVRVNSFTNTLPALAVVGAHAAYESYLAASTNNTATFRGFARQYTRDLMEAPLKELGRARQLTDAKVDKIQQSISANWENATAAQRNLLLQWLELFPVAP